jgi:hypothetical protein
MPKPITAEIIDELKRRYNPDGPDAGQRTNSDRDDNADCKDDKVNSKRGGHRNALKWPEPKPIQGGLKAVEAFDINFIPAALGPRVDDLAERLQCPPDYVAVAAITSLGSVIGRRAGIKPQAKTDWVEIPNLWGCFIGRPGMLKSPAMGEALKPIHHLEAEAAKENEIAQEAYTAGLSAYKLRQQVKITLEKKHLKKNPRGPAVVEMELGDPPEEPIPVRYLTNDCSYEALGEVLIGNPSGILVARDELVSLLQHLDRDDQAVARGFYMSGWSGTQPYTFDRIMRGHRHIEAICLSVLGSTQPARISEYIRRTNSGGAGGDGLIQRFGLIVWPDAPPSWKDVDEYPNTKARETAWDVYERSGRLDALTLGAHKRPFDKVPCFRFTEDAHAEFLDWRTTLEQRLRSGNLSPALEGHLAKYRKLVPALALINHIADTGTGDVSHKALVRALAFAHYLESHALRLYASGSETEIGSAKAILAHIKRGDLRHGFTARDVHQKGWAHLTERDQVGAGLNLLTDLDYIAEAAVEHSPRGGRLRIKYLINPKVLYGE